MDVIGVSDDFCYHVDKIIPSMVALSYHEVANLWECAEFFECFHLLSFVRGFQFHLMSSKPR